MAKLQYIHDETGKPQFVVLPIAEYQQLISNAKYEDIPYVADHDDDQTIPNEVVQ
ncbi:transcriptional regulator, partial [Yersinia enterocolitica]|nr:transcriptional regulator [Yersinia enterocolitica]